MNTTTHPPGFQPIRRDRLVQEAVHDTYKTKGKLHEPTICSDCGAVYHEGRWQWIEKPAGAHQTTCPACHRMHDDYPAGFVSISGEFVAAHEDEITSLIRHREAKEKVEHPMQRVIKIEQTPVGMEVTTTDIHLARGIGDALHHAYKGELDFHYNPAESLLRVSWYR